MKKAKSRRSTPAEKEATIGQARDADVRRVSRLFIAKPPVAYMSSGLYQPSKDEIAASPKYQVPDGRYRIVGLDPIYTFKGGHLIEITKGGPNVDPKGIVEVP